MIPDSHSHYQFNNDRYTWLGKLIHDLKPDVVVDIGDWWDLPSLCSYDKGHRSFEGRTYKQDINAGLDAQDRMFHEIKKHKKRLPRFIRTLGNHENRVNRAIELDRVLEGTIGTSDFQSKEYGFEEYPFLESVNVDGINYAHYFTSGVMNRPIGGEHTAYQLLMKNHVSCTQGHSHLKDYAVRKAGNKFIHGLSVGVYQDYDADYAGPANDLWHRGVVMCHNVEDGNYDLEFISLKRIRDAYQ